MPDLPPAEQPQPARPRRAARPKAKSYAARRASKPAAPPTSAEQPAAKHAEHTDTLKPAQTKASATHASEPGVNEAPKARPGLLSAFNLRSLAEFNRQMLLWAAIVAIASLVLSFGPGYLLTALGITQTDLQKQDAGLAEGVGCLTLLLSLVLPFVGGWRATTRQGDWHQGGMTGFWSVIMAEALILIIGLIFAVAAGQLNQLGLDPGSLLGGIGTLALFDFALGAMGGSYSVWQRRRAQQKQEALSSSS